MNRAPLTRKTPLKSTGALKRAPMKRRRKKRREGWNKTGDAYYSRAHLDFVKSHRCCIPGCLSSGLSDPHHIDKLGSGGGMALQCSDLRTVPLCRRHHDEWGERRRIGGATTETTMQFFGAVAGRMVRLSIEAGVLPKEVNGGR